MDASCVQLNHQKSMNLLPSINNIKTDSKPEKQEEKQEREASKCPRCESSNTKFCYYNNYSLTQPRYFCKACRRYWTKGGTLRNVPLGGGCRKNKRSSSTKTHLHFSPQLFTSFQSGNYFNHDFFTTTHVGNTHFDLFGGGSNDHQFNIGVGSDSYYGGGNNVNLMSQDEEHHHQQIGMHFDQEIKQDFELGGDGNRLLLNYFMNGGGGGGGGGLLGSTSWHNLINSPLM